LLSSGMLCLWTLVRADLSEERCASIIRVTRIGELRTTLAVTNNRMTLRRNTVVFPLLVAVNVPSSPISITLMMEVTPSFETWVLTRATRRDVPEDGNFSRMKVFSFPQSAQTGYGAHPTPSHPTPYPLCIRVISLGIYRPGRDARLLPASEREVKNVWSCDSGLSVSPWHGA
jgi:hypothetical protein